ncbi:uncharacterized protein LOC117190413 [Drosophila miranda]|uniref:uncharacterized protein LOC117190413 n=1 Tax=Drosophila miranda TaxID=7229 RepID=UPI00143F3CD1|nr:uncharacterized protein LOC117190413 [Drosophila miranda]
MTGGRSETSIDSIDIFASYAVATIFVYILEQTGPCLEPEEWRKRLNDWKNTTRCKYRRIMLSPGAKLSLSPLETRALSIFGEVSDVGALVFDDSAEYLEEHIDQEEPVDNYADYREDSSPPPKSIRISPRKAKQVTVQFPEEYTERPATKIINGQLPVKRVRVQVPEPFMRFAAARHKRQEIKNQLERIADIHNASLQFHVACFKYSNPGFEYSAPEL